MDPVSHVEYDEHRGQDHERHEVHLPEGDVTQLVVVLAEERPLRRALGHAVVDVVDDLLDLAVNAGRGGHWVLAVQRLLQALLLCADLLSVFML